MRNNEIGRFKHLPTQSVEKLTQFLLMESVLFDYIMANIIELLFLLKLCL